MGLPEIEVIGLQAVQRLLEHLHREILAAAVRAYLRHQKYAVAAAPQAFAHPDFALAAMIFPAVVEESDAAVYRFLDDAYRGLLVLGIAQMGGHHMASAESLYVVMTSETTQRGIPPAGRAAARLS